MSSSDDQNPPPPANPPAGLPPLPPGSALPPPPPPGPSAPQLPAQQMPTQQMPGTLPPTTVVPVQQAWSGGAPGGPGGDSQFTKKSKTPMYVIGGLVAAAVVVVGLLAFTGGDDGPAAEPDETEQPDETDVAVTEAPPETTAAPATTVAETVAPLTLPSTIVPVTTLPPETVPPTVTPAGVVDVADDTGAFVVTMPDSFELSTEPITLPGQGGQVAHVTGADDLAQYLTGDFSVIGVTVLAGEPAIVGTPADVLAIFDPADGCTSSTSEIGVPTSKGAATMIRYDGCGGADYSEVLIAVDLPELGRVLFLGLQGVGDSNGTPRTLALAMFDSIRRP